MKNHVAVLAAFLLIGCTHDALAQVATDPTTRAEYAFSSDSAKRAVDDFGAQTKKAEQEYQAAVAAAREKFKTSLKDSLKASANKGDLAEIKAITETLQLEEQMLTPPKEKEKPVGSTQLRSRIKSLEEEIANIKKFDPIVGRWNYHNGNVCEYTPEGMIMLNGKLIGIWRLKTKGTYVVAFTRDFASGEHDDVVLAPTGTFFEATGPIRTVKVDRVP